MRTINWSQIAQEDYWNTIDFLINRWTESEAIHFIDEVEQVLNILKKDNVTFKPTGYKNTYQIVIVKQITLYYQINQNNTIDLLRFFNNHQNPNKLNL